ncbi:MAG TPA: 30S ribosomal protein S20 [Gemmatales bacterium]|nr:30S ribosomal protein S20 [Gemmatales bacterium]HMP18124.1 30S ribosomal protein S20 [Gemmatales bacterium]
MPHTKSAKKRMRTSAERRARNRAVTKGLKLQHKAFEAALKSGEEGKLKEQSKLSMRKIDQAAAKGVIHKNTAARKKARLSRMLKKAAGTKS